MKQGMVALSKTTEHGGRKGAWG